MYNNCAFNVYLKTNIIHDFDATFCYEKYTVYVTC